MPVVRLKGLNSKTRTLADGSRVTYWWAWKGGPPLPGKPGSPEFVAAYNAAVADRKAPTNEDLASLVVKYKASPEFTRLADGTKKEWLRWLDRIMADEGPLDIGGLPMRLLDDRRVRADLLAWRDQWADRPRSADYAIQVLSRVLSWGLGRGLLALNAAAGVEQLYSSDRADQIWTADELQRFTEAASPEIGFALRLACLTGLRRTDLTKLAWAHVGEIAIVIPTGKSRGRRAQTIPILPELATLLDEIRAHQARVIEIRTQKYLKGQVGRHRPPPPAPTTVLTSSRGLPWTPSGLEGGVIDVKSALGIDKHLHDGRGTFGTRLRKAGLSASEIADVLGWEEERVERLLKTYIDQDAIVMEIAERIRRRESTTAANP